VVDERKTLGDNIERFLWFLACILFWIVVVASIWRVL